MQGSFISCCCFLCKFVSTTIKVYIKRNEAKETSENIVVGSRGWLKQDEHLIMVSRQGVGGIGSLEKTLIFF